MRIATSASRIARSRSLSSSSKDIDTSGYISRKPDRRGASHNEPNPIVVVTFNRPAGRSLLSVSSASVIASLANTSRTVRFSASPCSVRIRPRAWRWNSGTCSASSSAEIWRETADWLRFSVSPACVKLPASATAWKTRSLSQSIVQPLPVRPAPGGADATESAGTANFKTLHARRR
jgi:hypothetical protein